MSHPLQDLYDKVPLVHCTGQCGRDRHNTCCGPIGCSIQEAQILEQYNGVSCDWILAGQGKVYMDLPSATDAGWKGRHCPHLGLNGRCEAYEVRPMICRLYGTFEKLKCPWGCKPDRWLSRAQADELLAKSILRNPATKQ